MNLKLAIVGLPNVGKSTLFNALTKSEQAEAANYPFCTIEPNVGLVPVPDPRVDQLAAIVNPEKVVKSVVEFVDVAGLVRGASEGEGLGNKFLSHIRECQAVCHVVRAFTEGEVHHVNDRVNPADDLVTILMELVLADLQSVEKQLEKVVRKAKSGDKEAKILEGLLTRAKDVLADGKPASNIEVTDDEMPHWRQIQLLSAKPFMVIVNVDEGALADFDTEAFRTQLNGHAGTSPIVPICAKTEEELAGLDEADSAEYLASIGVTESGLSRLIHAGFQLLGLQSYFTAGVQEVRSWTIKKGATAPQAAGAIHTDFERGFIKAEVTAFSDYVLHAGEAGAKANGALRTEGKDYIVADGDVMHFRFNV